MIPELFHIGKLSISPFGVMLALSFVAALLPASLGDAASSRSATTRTPAPSCSPGLGGILGAKIYYAILYQDWRLLFERYGLVWYGGFILATSAILWTIRRRRLPPWPPPTPSLPACRGVRHGPHRLLPGRRRLRSPHGSALGSRVPGRLPPTDVENLREQFGIDFPASMAPDQWCRCIRRSSTRPGSR